MTIKLPKAIEAYFEADRTGAPCVVIGQRAADLIRATHGLTAQSEPVIQSV